MTDKTQTPTKFNYPEAFEALWKLYPQREGGNNKKKAFKAYSARIKQNHLHVNIENGVLRYKAFMDATGKIGSEFVMMAATFFGPDEHFYEPWDLPKEKPKSEAWEQKALRLNIDPRPGESMDEYKQRVMQHREDQGMPDAK